MEREKITASTGMILTDGETYGKVIYLGAEDKKEKYHEITEAEYNEILSASLESVENE